MVSKGNTTRPPARLRRVNRVTLGDKALTDVLRCFWVVFGNKNFHVGIVLNELSWLYIWKENSGWDKGIGLRTIGRCSGCSPLIDREHIHVLHYIWLDDRTGNDVASAKYRACKRVSTT